MSPSKDVVNEISLLREQMSLHGLKWTPQREEIAKWVFSNHEHFTVETIIESLKEKDRKVPPATVYRVVQMLRDLGILIEHNFGEGAKYYEHVPGHPHHDHMICKNCSTIIEFTNDKMETLQEEIAKSYDFDLENHTLVFFGICKNCKDKETKNKKKK